LDALKCALKEAKIELISAKEAQIKAEPVPLQIEEISPKEAQKTISPVKLETGLFRQKKLKSRRFLFRVHPGEHGFYLYALAG